MEKVNMKVVTVDILKAITELKKISSDYPSTWNTFPIAIYRTSTSPHFTDASGQELQSKWNVTIELFSNASLTDITATVLQKFGDIGFTGTQKDANTADLRRIIIDLSAIVDNKTNYVYSK